MRARQIWDEVKHGQLHADVLLRGGFIKREEELMDDARANTQPKLSYFGMTAMFPHIHPLARAGQHYYNESMACLGIAATLSVIDDDLIRHQLHSQSAEELMHFMEGKYQIDAYALTPEDQKPIEEVFDFLLRPWAPEPSRAFGGKHNVSASNESPNRRIPLHRLRPVPRSLPRARRPSQDARHPSHVRSDRERMHRLRRLPALLSGAWRFERVRP